MSNYLADKQAANRDIREILPQFQRKSDENSSPSDEKSGKSS